MSLIWCLAHFAFNYLFMFIIEKSQELVQRSMGNNPNVHGSSRVTRRASKVRYSPKFSSKSGIHCTRLRYRVCLNFLVTLDLVGELSGARSNMGPRRPMCQIWHKRSSRCQISSKFSRMFSQVLKTPNKYLSSPKAFFNLEKNLK